MMKLKKTKKWTLYVLVFLLIISVASCFGVKSQIKQHTGENTELVDSSLFNPAASPIAITNVSVLSSDCTKMLDSLTVLIKDEKIIQVAKEVSIPNEYIIVDATGQYLIPGLVDTHAHLHRSKNDLLLYLANGVTHIANNSSESDNLLLTWREEAEKGALSPKIYIAAGGMSSKKGVIQKIKTLFGDSRKYNTSAQARRAVKKFKSQGYDAIKSYNPNREVYIALTNEAKKQNIPVIGHLPTDVSLEDLYSSGQSQLAHVEEIIKATIREFGGMWSDNSEEYLTFLKDNADQIAVKLKKNKIVVSSTLWIIESIPKQNFEIDNFLKTIKLEYQNPGQIEGSKLAKGWLPGNNSYENMDIKNSPEQIKDHKLFWKTYVEAIHIMTKALVKQGVTITAGTDSNTPGVVAGFSLHDELESLSKSGLTEDQVLYAATVAPSDWMHSNAGKIEIGRRADLVLLNKNPLGDIKNTRAINAVITKGKYLDRMTLDKILESIKLANNDSRKINIDKFIK
ncbi:MAG: amidohydrolase family protein [Maribacter litoralis]|uniref:amidohydrolase family protein n=1 Tax=Maribacter litoralis TaxID=2059726 RepID=UPI00329976EB